MSERSPGIGREERPPIAVVVHSLIRFCNLFLYVTTYEWMHVMFTYMSEISSFSKINISEY